VSHEIRAEEIRDVHWFLDLASADGPRDGKRLLAKVDLESEHVTYQLLRAATASVREFDWLNEAVDAYNAIDEG